MHNVAFFFFLPWDVTKSHQRTPQMVLVASLDGQRTVLGFERDAYAIDVRLRMAQKGTQTIENNPAHLPLLLSLHPHSPR